MIDRAQLVDLLIVTAAVILAAGYLLAGVPLSLPFIAVPLLLWLIGRRRKWRGSSSFAVFLLVITAVLAILLAIPAIFSILTMVIIISAWEVKRLHDFLDGAQQVEHEALIVRRFRQRLLTVMIAGTLIAGVSSVIRISFSFSTALFLGLLSIIGASRAISYLRRESS